MTAIVFPTKRVTHVQRPDTSSYESFPSGHIQPRLFWAVSMMHKEFWYRSHRYGVEAIRLQQQ
ncbi:MAG: hypothetical protein K2X86_10920 [Cytophagaceae bacterium]|nr:hypothetical protein [Cytophagaceae bacterium]